MSKIVKQQVNVNHSVFTEFSQDKGFFTMFADVWSIVEEIPGVTHKGKPVYDHDITDICTSFRIDGKPVKSSGFEELYDKLYGDGSFAELLLEFEHDVEISYYETTEYTVGPCS